jgi:lysozyme
MRINNKIPIIAGIAILLILISKKVSAAKFISKHEGLRLNAYQDTGGVWTIGYGSTYNHAQNRAVKRGDRISQETALQWLEKDTISAQTAVKAAVKVPINRNQLIALTSLAYNIGNSAFRRSTLLRLLNAGNPKSEVAQQFLRWRFDNGIEVEGLLNRRKDEMALFLK